MSDFYKHMALSSITIIVSLLGFWLMHGRDLITRNEAIDLIKVHSQLHNEYVKDKEYIRKTMDDTSELTKETNKMVHELKSEVTRIRQQIDDIDTRSSLTKK